MKSNRPPLRSKALTVAASAVLAMGLLLWLKLRMVSQVPRTAYAEPDPATIPQAPTQTPPSLLPEFSASPTRPR